MIEKYVLFSPVGFNDAVGNKLNIDLVKNKLNYDLKNNNLPAYNDKIKSMLEYLNVNSEINTEGTILSIVRKYKPKKVLLLFTPEMIIKENKDSVNIFDILEKEITKRSSECIVEKKLIKYHNTFDADIMSNEGETFYDMINDLKRDYEDYKILVNITSSTAQIKTRIALECVETNFNIIPIYLSDPLRSKISTSAIQYFAPSSEEYKEPVRSNILDRLDKIDTIWDEYEDYTIYRENNIINDDIYYKKYSVAKLSILVQNRIKSQIAALIERSYEYKTCYELFKDNDFIKENFQDVLILLRYADFRVKLKYSDYELKKENINLDADCLKYIQDKLNSFDNAEKILIEYFYLMKLKQKKGDLSDFILMLTPFLENIKYCKDKKLISSLNKIENKLRNTAAHQMVNVSEEDILKKCNISSKDIINKCSALLKLIFMKKFDEKYFVYDEINKRILEKL